MAYCKGCGGSYRKGTRVLLVLPSGTQERALVCPKCAGKGLTVCAVRQAPVVKQEVKGDVDKTLNAAIRQLRVLMAAANAVACGNDREMEFEQSGKAQGYEGAIVVLKRLKEQGGTP
jgi:hypothetical protein